jgi:transcriptional regulator with XRE-family HTH domain
MKRAASDSRIIGIVATNVRAARKAAGLSQEELAFEARVDRTYISQVERKQRNVTISVLARIAKALGVTPDKLLIPSVFSTFSGKRRRISPPR